MNALIGAALTHSRTVLATLVLLLVAGWVAYKEIPKEAAPDVNIPIIYVSLHYEGISPEDSERLLLRPMEQELRTIEGLKEMRSTAYQGGGNVIMEFDAGFNADKALSDVRDRVDRAKAELPAGTDEPTVNEVNFSLFPVLAVILSGDVPERTLLTVARDLKDRIETIPAVLKAEIGGDRDELVEVVIDPLRVESYGINPATVVQLFNRSNRLVAAGNLDTGAGRFPVKVPGLFETVRDIRDMPVKVNGDAVVAFRDVAEVRRTFKDPESFARVDGKPALALEITKRTGENIIETIEQVRAVVEAERAYFPAGLIVTYSQDRSRDIRDMLGDLENNLAVTVLLVMIIVVATLGVRTSTLVVVAVPGSFLTAMLVLAGMGHTINVVVLFGLILAAGNVVDGAIVVTEYADRKMAEGMDKRRAYGLAARRMAWPILASTATQLAAFAPLLFWPGMVGEFMKFLPISQFATLTAALLMALIFIPVLGALFGKANAPLLPQAPANRLRADFAADESDPVEERRPLGGWYVALLRGALRHPAKVLLGSTLLLVGIQGYYALHGNGVEFFPDIEPTNATVLVHARGNLSIHEQDALVREVEAHILRLDDFESVYSRTGKPPIGRDVPADVIGQITLEFKEWQERRPATVVLEDIRARTAGLAGIVVEPRKQDEGPPTGKPVQVRLSSRHPDLLPDAVRHVRAGMAAVGGLIDVEDSRPLPGIEWQVEVDRAQAARFGLDVTAVGDAVRLVTNGLKIAEYRPDDADDEIDIVVRYPRELRSMDQLDSIRIDTGAGAVPVANFVDRVPRPRVGQIDRVDGQRTMTVKADVAPGVLADDKVRALRAWLAANPPDPRVDHVFKGEDEEQAKSAAFLSRAFVAALFIMAIILVTQFNSFYSAFLILTSVILSTIGVTIGLIVTGQPFGIVMTGVGVIALAGTVVQNNIVLIDTFDQYKQTEPTVFDAILRTGAERARPVLLTAFNTVLGLLPLAFGMNIDLLTREVTFGAPATQWWIGLSSAIVFGLAFATVLTLVVTPCALMVKANLHDWRVARQRRLARWWTRNRPWRRPDGAQDNAGVRDAAE
ncbi:efflux RND transporter permease subunit [Azospirillum halopraeferens]|uniref:efflux RND transporter permease subunit n=1 Tax=Azospirillum halopraeferens TaxID=34010 RepID=UPI0004079D48|nr:efflux RND transporter permease subunit [Azospirillum halopraeferens]